MKIVTLNIWGGHVHEPLLNFMKTHQDIDVFCLQEVYHGAAQKVSTDDRVVYLDIFDQIERCLPKHKGFFRPVIEDIYGLAMFVSDRVNILGEGDVMIHEDPAHALPGPAHSRNMQWLMCEHEGETLSVLNVHCLWNGKGKGDSPERIEQSKRMKAFMSTLNTPMVLCGDFNLTPDTESMAIVNEGMSNLVDNYHVTSTRTSYYKKPIRFADYILLSKDLKEKHFEVMPDEVSDHSLLLVEL